MPKHAAYAQHSSTDTAARPAASTTRTFANSPDTYSYGAISNDAAVNTTSAIPTGAVNPAANVAVTIASHALANLSLAQSLG